MFPRLLAISSLTIALSAVPGSAQTNRGGNVGLSPSLVTGTATSHHALGGFTAKNTTQEDYTLDIFASGLTQTIDGALVLNDDPASRRAAAALLAIQKVPDAFGPGMARTAQLETREVARDQGIYVAAVFQATPVPGASTSQVRRILRLTANVLLDPQVKHIEIGHDPVLPTQTGPHQFDIVIPVTNLGNVYIPFEGRSSIRNPQGKTLARVPLKSIKTLPDAHVELRGPVAARLPAGDYVVHTKLRAGSKTVLFDQPMKLFGLNEVATRAAKITKFVAPPVYKGEAVDLHAQFRNTGNVEFAPGADIQVRRFAPGGTGTVLKTIPVTAATTKPGKVGEVTGKLDLPDLPSMSLTLRLKDGNRVLDQTYVGVIPQKRPPSKTSSVLWIVIAIAVAAAIAAGLLYRRRRRGPGAGPPATEPAPPPATTTTMPPAAALPEADGRVDINSATVEELATLPGVGPKAAQRIVDHREEYGAFASLEDLAEVEGFGEKRIAQIASRAHV